VGYGRLHYPLDALGAQAAVSADELDFQQAPVIWWPRFFR